MDEIIIDEDDRFIYCEKIIDNHHIRYVKDKRHPEIDFEKLSIKLFYPEINKDE